MPLHRDIFWLGRQWAVTGFGMQAINQKYSGQFDIPIDRLWDDDLPDGVSDQKWFNLEDFNRGLAIARTRFPPPPPKPEAPPLPVEMLLRASSAAAASEPMPVVSAAEAPSIATIDVAPATVAPPMPKPSFFEMRVLAHPAKLLRVWRARRRR